LSSKLKALLPTRGLLKNSRSFGRPALARVESMSVARLFALALVMLHSSAVWALRMSSANCVFLSRFSGLDPLRLRNAMEQNLRLAKPLGSTSRLVYLPTASFIFSSTSEKPKGEQRRRMRYEARAKALLLAQSFSERIFERHSQMQKSCMSREETRSICSGLCSRPGSGISRRHSSIQAS
jgi:hypothetical protein